jgi:drug/metabolite transporter (DMT)-like permease
MKEKYSFMSTKGQLMGKDDLMKTSKWLILGPLFVILGAGLWGTETYFRVNLNTRFDSEVLVFYEHLFCIVFSFPFLFLSLSKIRNIPKRSWIYLILSGVIGSAIGTTLFTMSLNELNPSVANVLLNFQPIVTVIFASLLLKENLGRGFFLWGALALVAGAVIAANDFEFSQVKLNVGIFYISLTAIAWGFSTVAGRGAMIHMPLGIAAFGRFFVGAITIFVSLFVKGHFTSEMMKFSSLSDLFVVKNFLLLSVGAGVIPLFFYFKGLSKTSATVGGFCELTQTFTALLLTWGIMHNPLSAKQVIAGLILIVCVYRINLNFSKANALENLVPK